MIKRIISVMIGTTILGHGISILLYVNLGVDPFTSLVVGIQYFFNTSFWLAQMGILSVFLVFVFLFNRRYLGIGTLVNTFYTGFVIDMTTPFIHKYIPQTSMNLRLIFLLVGILLVSFGASQVMSADLGISTYDALAPMIEEKTGYPFKYIRITTDFFAVVIGYLLGAVVGIGTILMTLTVGPLISFFLKVFDA